MYKLIIVSLLTVGMLQISGCGSDADAADLSNNMLIDYEVFGGIQTDIFHQKVEVINTIEVFNNFWLSIPSMSDEMPPFDESENTFIGIISESVSCVFSPSIVEVEASSQTITIRVVNELVQIPEQAVCDPLPFPFYAYNIVKIGKSGLPISVIIENE
jgi:hypothetical protein